MTNNLGILFELRKRVKLRKRVELRKRARRIAELEAEVARLKEFEAVAIAFMNGDTAKHAQESISEAHEMKRQAEARAETAEAMYKKCKGLIKAAEKWREYPSDENAAEVWVAVAVLTDKEDG